jgi:hypothetical protein
MLSVSFIMNSWNFTLFKEESVMKKINERVSKAQDAVLDRVEYVIDVRETPDFVEVVGDIGGDVVTYRVYDDGRVYAR